MTTILVVDDEVDILNLVQRALASRGYNVLIANDGAEALRIYVDHKVDLVLSDIKMPIMDGISLALALKAKSPEVLIVLMTGYADQKERAAGLNFLISDVINKPFDLDTLFQTIESALSSASL